MGIVIPPKVPAPHRMNKEKVSRLIDEMLTELNTTSNHWPKLPTEFENKKWEEKKKKGSGIWPPIQGSVKTAFEAVFLDDAVKELREIVHNMNTGGTVDPGPM